MLFSEFNISDSSGRSTSSHSFGCVMMETLDNTGPLSVSGGDPMLSTALGGRSPLGAHSTEEYHPHGRHVTDFHLSGNDRLSCLHSSKHCVASAPSAYALLTPLEPLPPISTVSTSCATSVDKFECLSPEPSDHNGLRSSSCNANSNNEMHHHSSLSHHNSANNFFFSPSPPPALVATHGRSHCTHVERLPNDQQCATDESVSGNVSYRTLPNYCVNIKYEYDNLKNGTNDVSPVPSDEQFAREYVIPRHRAEHSVGSPFSPTPTATQYTAYSVSNPSNLRAASPKKLFATNCSSGSATVTTYDSYTATTYATPSESHNETLADSQAESEQDDNLNADYQLKCDAMCPSEHYQSLAMTNSPEPMDEQIDTRDLAQRISAELKRYSIPQAIFAQRVLCRSQGTLSDLLRNPKPWSKLKSGRETFRRMAKWLHEPEFQRMSALRLAACKRKEEQHSSGSQTPAPKKPRLVFTDIQRRTLQAIFKETKRPSREMQLTISQQLNLDPTTVANFFMNARRRGHDRTTGRDGMSPTEGATDGALTANEILYGASKESSESFSDEHDSSPTTPCSIMGEGIPPNDDQSLENYASGLSDGASSSLSSSTSSICERQCDETSPQMHTNSSSALHASLIFEQL
jgi:hypothetical protein